MDIFEWENGTITERPYIEIDGVKYYVQDGTISGGTPVTANNLNEMQDIINENILDIYSTEEIKTNKVWIDDKPIYRKVYVLNSLPNSSSLQIDISLWNIQTIVSLLGYTNTGLVFNGTRTGNNTGPIDLFADITQNKINLITYQDRTNMSGFIIIEYTKS